MRSLRTLILALPILGGVLAGCGSDDSSNAPTKAQEAELRNPTHVPPAGYKPPSSGPPPAPATQTRPPGG